MKEMKENVLNYIKSKDETKLYEITRDCDLIMVNAIDILDILIVENLIRKDRDHQKIVYKAL